MAHLHPGLTQKPIFNPNCACCENSSRPFSTIDALKRRCREPKINSIINLWTRNDRNRARRAFKCCKNFSNISSLDILNIWKTFTTSYKISKFQHLSEDRLSNSSNIKSRNDDTLKMSKDIRKKIKTTPKIQTGSYIYIKKILSAPQSFSYSYYLYILYTHTHTHLSRN